MYDGANPAAEVVWGAVVARYLSGPAPDEWYGRTDASGTQSFLTDGLGSTIALTDSTGAVQTRYTYEPFGGTTVSGAASSNTMAYTGREMDGTGLYYYRARYYDPTIGRFISEDPLGFDGGGVNLYSYVNNSPLSFYDPWGLMSWEFNVTARRKGSWFYTADTDPGRPRIDVSCGCGENGGYKASLNIRFDIDILYGTQSQLDHEYGHLKIMKDFLNSRTAFYANKYERMYSNKKDCRNSEDKVRYDLLKDWQKLTNLQDDHESYLQKALVWATGKITQLINAR